MTKVQSLSSDLGMEHTSSFFSPLRMDEILLGMLLLIGSCSSPVSIREATLQLGRFGGSPSISLPI